MHHSDPSFNKRLGNGWQIVQQFELTVNPDANPAVVKQLTTILSSLNLPADFLNRVLMSAADYMAHALQAHGEVTLRHIHLSIFSPNKLNSGSGNWGFFRIEKTDRKDQNEGHPNHEVEFYLYVEGE